MNDFKNFSALSRALIVLAAIAIALIFLNAAASVVAPILLAAFIAIVVTAPLRGSDLPSMRPFDPFSD